MGRFRMSWFFWILLAVFCWGIAPLAAKLGLAKSAPLSALLIRSIIVFFILLGWGACTGHLSQLKSIEPRTWLLLAGEGILGAIIGQWAYYNALKAGPLTAVIPLSATYPLMGLLLAVLLLGEKLSWGQVTGSFLIVAGIYLVYTS
ncbi:MAG TPA: hypothetical protein ENM97_02170 [Moorella mulderi]|nr:hypothetical protein [Moorella mulderi]